MSRCDLCPNEADLYWDPPELKALTPAGVALLTPLRSAGERVFMCATCFKERAEALGAEARQERLRRSQGLS